MSTNTTTVSITLVPPAEGWSSMEQLRAVVRQEIARKFGDAGNRRTRLTLHAVRFDERSGKHKAYPITPDTPISEWKRDMIMATRITTGGSRPATRPRRARRA